MAAPEWDPYVVLNVPRRATGEEIRAAYLLLAARYHPDQHQGNPLEELASARMAEINRAYEVLSDPARRAAFDAGSQTRTTRDAADRAMRGALIRLLFEALGSLRGPRLAAGAGLVALVVLLVATFKRRRR
jgi:curved DNA-binding protein CbpA